MSTIALPFDIGFCCDGATENLAELINLVSSLKEVAAFQGVSSKENFNALENEILILESFYNKGLIKQDVDLERIYSIYIKALMETQDKIGDVSTQELVDLMKLDISIKNRYIRQYSGLFNFQRTLRAFVRIEVRQRDKPGLIEGISVQANPLIAVRTGREALVYFPTTNGAERFVLPGVYLVQLIKGGRKIAEQIVEFEVSANPSGVYQIFLGQ